LNGDYNLYVSPRWLDDNLFPLRGNEFEAFVDYERFLVGAGIDPEFVTISFARPRTFPVKRLLVSQQGRCLKATPHPLLPLIRVASEAPPRSTLVGEDAIAYQEGLGPMGGSEGFGHADPHLGLKDPAVPDGGLGARAHGDRASQRRPGEGAFLDGRLGVIEVNGFRDAVIKPRSSEELAVHDQRVVCDGVDPCAGPLAGLGSSMAQEATVPDDELTPEGGDRRGWEEMDELWIYAFQCEALFDDYVLLICPFTDEYHPSGLNVSHSLLDGGVGAADCTYVN